MRSLALVAMLLAPAELLGADPAKPDPRVLARKVVEDSARVAPGDFVLITGTFDDRDLLEDLAVAVRHAGGNPLISVDSDAMLRRFFLEVPEDYDAQAGAVRKKLAESIQVRIRVDRGESPGGAYGIPSARLTAQHESFQAANTEEARRNVRRVVLGNGLFPTEASATRFGMKEDELGRLFWAGLDVDYQRLQKVGEKLRSQIAGGKVLELSSKSGTRLTMRVEGRQVVVSDGVISPEDIKAGGARTVVWLPAGEVYFTPVPGTAEGRLVVPRQIFQSAEVVGLTLDFKAGKLVSMTAKSGLESIKPDYDAATAGKELFGLVDIGINPNVTIPRTSKLHSYLPAGSVMVGLGGNAWAGGDNPIVYTLDSFLTDCTVKVDGKVLVDAGVLK